MDLLKESYFRKQLVFYLPPHLAKIVAETVDDEILEAMIPTLLPYIEQMRTVSQNREEAHQDIPESMYGVKKLMLYIPISINGKYFEAFIDSGASMSIMSKEVATDAGVLYLCDPTMKIKAIGVGSQTTLGKIHKVDFMVNDSEISWGFDIMESKGLSLILGLDFLRSYRAKIDMEKDCLVINDIHIPFLKKIHMHDSKKEKLELKDIYGEDMADAIKKSEDTDKLKKALKMSIQSESENKPAEDTKDDLNDEELAMALSLSLKEN